MKKSFSYPVQMVTAFLALAAFFTASAFQQPEPTRGLSPWVWILIIIVLVLIVAWLLVRGTRQSTPPPPHAPTRTDSPIQTFDVPAEKPVDDLTIIEGIGPKIAQILSDAGIKTYDQLAEAEPARLEDILRENRLQMADPSSWSEQARLAAAGDQAGLQELQARLNAGREG